MAVTGFRDRSISCARWVGWILGILLLIPAILKISQGFLEGLPKASWLSPLHVTPRVVLLLGCAEGMLALWLISGVKRAWSLGVAAAMFFCFAAAGLWMVVQGIPDCGCFGPLRLSPRVTYWVDVLALIASVWTLDRFRIRILFAVFLVPLAALYAGALALVPSQHPTSRIEVGKPWPSAQTVACSADLCKGRWVVLIHGSGCARCRLLADDYAEEAAGWAAQGKQTKLALLDADDAGDPGIKPPSFVVARGGLLQADLYHHAPILLLLDQGKVLAVYEGWEAADWFHPPFSFWVR